MRDTSLDTYHKLVSTGMLSKRRRQVAEFIAVFGPTYQRKAHKELSKLEKSNSSSFMSRFCELEKMDVIEIVGEGFDEDTGNRVYLYDLTGRMPVRFEKPKRIKCKSCDGKGYHETTQTKLF